MSHSKRELLFTATFESCGDVFEMWAETYDDGTWSLHFHAPCRKCEQMARRIADSLAQGAPIFNED